MMRNRVIRRGLLAVALLVSVPAALAASAGPASASISPPIPLPPPPGVCEPVEVRLVKLTEKDGVPVIVVLGTKLRADATIRLDPEDIDFVRQPDHFPYIVSGCGGSGAISKVPFQAVFPVPVSPVGRLGISINEFLVDLFPDAKPAS